MDKKRTKSGTVLFGATRYTLRPTPYQGFTLIEVLVVLGIFVALILVTSLLAFNSTTRSSVSGERDLVALMLTGARARALANVNEQPQGVRITDNEIILFEGTSYPGINQRTTPRGAGIAISPSPADVVFEQLSGGVPACVAICTITLGNGSQSYSIDINSSGRIEW